MCHIFAHRAFSFSEQVPCSVLFYKENGYALAYPFFLLLEKVLFLFRGNFRKDVHDDRDGNHDNKNAKHSKSHQFERRNQICIIHFVTLPASVDPLRNQI